MAKKAYPPPTVKMIDGTFCHYCNERPFVAGLVLPNGVQVCRECYDKHVEKDPKKKTKRRR
jgi:formylmethanofuran dehydrogenase subunit E